MDVIELDYEGDEGNALNSSTEDSSDEIDFDELDLECVDEDIEEDDSNTRNWVKQPLEKDKAYSERKRHIHKRRGDSARVRDFKSHRESRSGRRSNRSPHKDQSSLAGHTDSSHPRRSGELCDHEGRDHGLQARIQPAEPASEMRVYRSGFLVVSPDEELIMERGRRHGRRRSPMCHPSGAGANFEILGPRRFPHTGSRMRISSPNSRSRSQPSRLSHMGRDKRDLNDAPLLEADKQPMPYPAVDWLPRPLAPEASTSPVPEQTMITPASLFASPRSLIADDFDDFPQLCEDVDEWAMRCASETAGKHRCNTASTISSVGTSLEGPGNLNLHSRGELMHRRQRDHDAFQHLRHHVEQEHTNNSPSCRRMVETFKKDGVVHGSQRESQGNSVHSETVVGKTSNVGHIGKSSRSRATSRDERNRRLQDMAAQARRDVWQRSEVKRSSDVYRGITSKSSDVMICGSSWFDGASSIELDKTPTHERARAVTPEAVETVNKSVVVGALTPGKPAKTDASGLRSSERNGSEIGCNNSAGVGDECKTLRKKTLDKETQQNRDSSDVCVTNTSTTSHDDFSQALTECVPRQYSTTVPSQTPKGFSTKTELPSPPKISIFERVTVPGFVANKLQDGNISLNTSVEAEMLKKSECSSILKPQRQPIRGPDPLPLPLCTLSKGKNTDPLFRKRIQLNDPCLTGSKSLRITKTDATSSRVFADVSSSSHVSHESRPYSSSNRFSHKPLVVRTNSGRSSPLVVDTVRPRYTTEVTREVVYGDTSNSAELAVVIDGNKKSFRNDRQRNDDFTLHTSETSTLVKSDRSVEFKRAKKTNYKRRHDSSDVLIVR